jgi:DNA-binding HxlR family transcriptional regulator
MMNDGRVGFHEDLQMIIKGLDQSNRQEIIKILRRNTRMSFSEIEKESKINSSLLASHLNNLINNLLVERYYDHYSEKNSYSYYELSNMGKRIIFALEAAFYDTPNITETRDLEAENVE